MEIGSFGVEDSMSIRWVEIKKQIQEYIRNQLKEDIWQIN
jgi:hypothetical protein